MFCCYVHRAHPLSLYDYYIMLLHRCTVPQAHRKRGGKTGLRPGKTDFGIGMNSLENAMKNAEKAVDKNAGVKYY